MGYSPSRSKRPPVTREEKQLQRAVLALTLGQAQPNHEWHEDPLAPRPGCDRCPWGSPFRNSPASHLFIIKEEL